MYTMKNIIFFLSILAITFVGCESSDSSLSVPSSSDSGIAGSYARFMTVGHFLYVVDNANIITYNLSNPTHPSKINQQSIGDNIETIYNLGSKLFIGSGSGLYIYTIGDDGIPVQASSVSYDYPIYPCDPVVANDSLAFVTLNTETRGSCNRIISINQLKVFNVKNITQPQLINEIELPTPKGVGLDGNLLFVCVGTSGLMIFDISNPSSIELIEHKEGFTTFDVIPLDGLLLVVGPDNVYQFDYTNINNITRVSAIPINS